LVARQDVEERQQKLMTGYAIEQPGTATPLRSVLLPTGLAGTALPGPDGLVTTTLPDGRVMTSTPGADPRFGMLTPFRRAETLTTPGGRSWSLTRSRAATLLDPSDLLSFATLEESTTINGKTFLDVFTKSTRTLVRTTPAGRQVTTTLDTQGRVVQVSVPGIVPMVLSYDGHGRLETVTQGTRTMTRGYWPDGYLATVTDPLNQVTTFTPDLVGRVEEVLRPNGETVLYDHDDVGNLVAVTPPGQAAHTFGYSGVDQRSSYDPPALPTGPTPTIWAHDIDRRLDSITRPDGIVVSYLRDQHGRLKHVTWPGGMVTRSYHPTTGKLVGLSGPGSVALAFIHDGHLLTDAIWSGEISGTVHTDYNNHLRASSETVNSVHAVSFAHDDDGLLTGAGPLTLTRSPQNGRVEGLTVGGVVETLTFDPFGDLDDRVVTANGATVFAVDVVQRDALGRIIEKVETIAGETHTFGCDYDLAGRLDHVYRDGVLVADYGYDGKGNRTSLTTPQGQVIGVPDAQDRLESYGALSFTYRASGELESRTDTTTGATTLYGYDPLGNLRQVTLPGGSVIEYIVDGSGRRVGKKVNGALAEGWLYRSALQPAAELDASGAVVARFLYGERVNVPDVMIKGGITYRLVTDHVGSVRLVVDAATGTITQRMDYNEFGEVVLDTNPGFQPFGFAGGLYDPDTGLVRFGARDYDPEIGRWTAKDPLLFDGGDTNLYAYALMDPINRADPSGRIAIAVPIVLAELAMVALVVTIGVWETVDAIQDICTFAKGLEDADPLEDDATDDSPPDSTKCWAAYLADRRTCRTLKASNYGKRACYESASERYAACLRGKRLPDLVTWAN
jgi:RHS repeat-associated protein